MEKTPRYTQRERNMVLGYAARHKDIIENKRTDAESNRKKDEVWLQIAKEFNARAYHQRSAKQLRQLYKNMKLLLKKDLSGEDRGNRSFMELLNTLANQDSVAQYITEQMSPDSGGGASYSGLLNGSGGGDGARSIKDDFDDSKMHFENMDAEVILIKSETISDNEGENGMHSCMDDDDDDDCLSPKAPEVCLEEEDEELFATDLRQMNQAHSCSGSSPFTSTPNTQSTNHTHNAQLPQTTNALTTTTSTATAPTASTVPAAITAPQCPTSTSPTTALFGSGSKPEITIQNVGGIRVGAFASLSKTLQNGNSNSLLAIQPANSPNTNGGATSSGNSSGANGIAVANAAQLPLTPEQVQQHLLLNGLGLSAVHPPASVLPTLSTTPNVNTRQSALSPSPSPMTRTGMNCNNGSGNSGGGLGLGLGHAKHLLLNGHGNSNSKSMYNGGHQLQHQTQQHSSHSSGGTTGSHASTKSQHNEYLMKLTIEERKLKIELLNAQIVYWQTLTKKLDANSGHYPTPSCLCHFPGGNMGSNAVVTAAAVAAAANGLQSQASSS